MRVKFGVQARRPRMSVAYASALLTAMSVWSTAVATSATRALARVANSHLSWVTDLNPTLIRSADPSAGVEPLFGGRVNALAVDPANPQVIFAASEAGGVFV